MAARWYTVAKTSAIALAALTAAAAFAAPPVSPASPPTLAPPSAEAALASIAFDPTALDADASARHYRFRNWIREHAVSNRDLARYQLKLDKDWQDAPADKRLVILIHGFNSTPARTAALLDPAKAAHIPCGMFAYPNDYLLPAAAQLLSQQLRELAHDHPDRHVALVCHSTGGLVARACLEDAALDPGNVDRLIMVAPPTHGSQLARFAVGTDVWEHWLSRKDGWPWTRMHDSIIDGLGEAADELCPDSEFLKALNARQRNAHVRYSILLGTKAVVDEAEMAWLRQNVCDRLKKVPGIDGRAERLDALLADLDELVDGRGDGVVAIKRGRLDGVEDTVVMPFNHMAIGATGDRAELTDVYRAVLERVR